MLSAMHISRVVNVLAMTCNYSVTLILHMHRWNIVLLTQNSLIESSRNGEGISWHVADGVWNIISASLHGIFGVTFKGHVDLSSKAFTVLTYWSKGAESRQFFHSLEKMHS